MWKFAMNQVNIFYATVILIVSFLTGCASIRTAKQGEVIGNEYFSIAWNTTKWSLANDIHQTRAILTQGASSRGSKSMRISIKHLNIAAYIRVRNQAYLDQKKQIFLPGSSIFFDKDSDYKKVSREDDGLPKMMTHNNRGKRVYHPKWEKVIYVNDMKCLHNILLRGSVSLSKTYKIYCGYYDKNKGRRILFISLEYDRIAPTDQWTDFTLSVQPPSTQPLEDHLKNAVEHLIATLKIKNFDRARMESEGLLHPNKQFQLLEY